jgi:hypothetical protein
MPHKFSFSSSIEKKESDQLPPDLIKECNYAPKYKF